MVCYNTISFKGDRINKIKEMIQRILKERFEKKELPLIVKNPELVKYRESLKKARDEYELQKKLYENFCDKLKIDETSFGNNKIGYKVSYNECFIPQIDIDLLTRAQNYNDLGKKNDARKLIQSLIDKYDLYNIKRE